MHLIHIHMGPDYCDNYSSKFRIYILPNDSVCVLGRGGGGGGGGWGWIMV